MKVVTLIENGKLDIPDITAEHGISLYIESNDKKILFDLGHKDTFYKNAKILNIDIGEVDYVIISHGHFDHAGGLKCFLENNKKARIIMKKSALEKHFVGVFGLKFNCGLDKELVNKNIQRFILLEDDYELDEDMKIITNIEKKYPLATTNNNIYKLSEGKKIRDDFNHELIFAVKENNKIIAFPGCGHSGILNIVETIKGYYGDNNKINIISGFHLKNPVGRKNSESDEKLSSIANTLAKDSCIEKIYTGHCTGERAYSIFKEMLGDKIEEFHTGQVINFDAERINNERNFKGYS